MTQSQDHSILPTSSSAHPADLDYCRRNIPCQWACPARTDIPGYIHAIHTGDYTKAKAINRQANLFPGTLGRVCSRPCESMCRHGDTDLGNAVSICHLKRFAADNADNLEVEKSIFPASGKSIGIVGGGPAGLTAAHTLAKMGHSVTIYEAMPKLGGMLLYGIPDFRVPPSIVKNDIDQILLPGIEVLCNKRLGQEIQLAELQKKHEAVILALGCYKERKATIPGENFASVYSGLDFMMNVNTGTPKSVGRRVAVLGGGFTAMDCARSALRLGAQEVTVYIRRTESEMAVTREEIHETKHEGIFFVSLVSAFALAEEEDGSIRIALRRNRLTTDRRTGVKRPVPIDDSDFFRQADTVIIAIGQEASQEPAWLNLPEDNTDIESGASQHPGLFLAGDFASGASTVIDAIGHARNVAINCDSFLMGKQRSQLVATYVHAENTSRKRAWDFLPPTSMPSLPLDKRFFDAQVEVETGFTGEIGATEAKRCYLCNLRYVIKIPDCIYCRLCIDVCPRYCIHMAADFSQESMLSSNQIVKSEKWNKAAAIVIDSDRCIRCGECLRVCPTQCIHVTDIRLANHFIAQQEQEND